MNITDWLSRSRKAEEELHMLTEARRRALEMLHEPHRRPGYTPPDPSVLEGMDRNILRQAEELAAVQAEIVDVVAGLHPESVRRLMTRVFLDGATIERAAEDLYYSPRHAARLIAKGKLEAGEILRARGVSLLPEKKKAEEVKQ